MKKKFVYWQDGDIWVGYFEDFPDYWTQGETVEELKENLRDIWRDLSSGAIPNVRRIAEWITSHSIGSSIKWIVKASTVES